MAEVLPDHFQATLLIPMRKARTLDRGKLKIAGTVLFATALLATCPAVLLKAAPQAAPPAQGVQQQAPEPSPRRGRT